MIINIIIIQLSINIAIFKNSIENLYWNLQILIKNIGEPSYLDWNLFRESDFESDHMAMFENSIENLYKNLSSSFDKKYFRP